MRKYRYAAVPLEVALLEASNLMGEDYRFSLNAKTAKPMLDTLEREGYRWAFSIDGYAVFEREVEAIPESILSKMKPEDRERAEREGWRIEEVRPYWINKPWPA